MNHRIVGFVAVLLGSIGAGCSSDPTADDVCAKRAQIVCSKRNQCSQGYSIKREFGTMAACEAWEKQACVESVERTGSGNTVSANEKCNSAMEKQTCEERASGEPLAACERQPGELKVGTPCLSSNQCASEYCKIAPGMTCGTCQTRQGDKGMCDQSGDCLEGFYCQRLGGATTGPGTCTAFQAPGQPCNNELRCGANVNCVGFSASAGTDGTCVARTQAVDADCNNMLRCNAGLQCVGASTSMGVTTNGKCKKPAVENEMCDRNGALAPNCDGGIGLYCEQEFTVSATSGNIRWMGTGVCKKRSFAATGGSCGVQMDKSDPTCQNGETCQRMLVTNMTTGAVSANTNMPGTCVGRASSGAKCNTNGDIGPGCPVGHSCVATNPGVSTEGTCVKRDYEVACLMKPSKS